MNLSAKTDLAVLAGFQRLKRKGTAFHPYEIRVRCCGQLHRILLTNKGRLVLCNHPKNDDSVFIMEGLTGKTCPCYEIRDLWVKACQCDGQAFDRLHPKLRALHGFRLSCWRHGFRRSLNHILGSDWDRIHDAKTRRWNRTVRLLITAMRDTTYASQYRKRLTQRRRVNRGELPRITGVPIRNPFRKRSSAFNIRIFADPVSVIMTHKRLGTLVARDRRRRLLILKHVSETPCGHIVIAGRERGSLNKPILRTRACEIRWRNNAWRVHRWLQDYP